MSIYDSLNDKQKEAVFCTEGPLLILAGAGSGKTRVLTHRIAYLIDEKGVNPWNILAITFTNKAAGEMKERVSRLVEFGADSVWVATFHATCVRILRRFADRLGYDTNFTIYDSDDSKTLIHHILKEKDLDPKLYRDKAILSMISNAKNQLISPDRMYKEAGNSYHARKEAELYEAYQAELKANNAMDFDDLLTKTVELFQKEAEVLEYYQERFRYILVDEYQDTNNVQFQFVRLLAQRYQNLCVVGDDDQSIYRFRGADITNILSFESYFAGAKVIKLEQNYRSTMNILETANEVIRNNAGRKRKSLWSEKGEGERVRFWYYENGYTEAEGIADAISQKVKNREASYQDFAVLYRTNAQSRSFEEKFIQNNVPYHLIGGVNFYQRQEIKDILAYLKTIDSGRDELAVKRIINVPRRGIGAATIEKVTAIAREKDISFFRVLEELDRYPSLGRSAAKLKVFVNQIMVLRAQAKLVDTDELIQKILETTGYLEELEDLEEEKAKQKQENLEELINKAADYVSQNENPDLNGFLEEVALVADIDSLDRDVDCVTLMTLHAAKGLEFPEVFLTGMEEGIFPGYMAVNSPDQADLEEERRLCYVGITRAMKTLTLTAARSRTMHGETVYNRISRFVDEISRDRLDRNMHQGQTDMEGLFRRRPSLSNGKEWTFGSDDSPRRSTSGPGFGRSISELDTLFDLKKKQTVSSSFASGKPDPGFRTGSAMEKKLPDYREGDRVSHIKFGQGKVLKIEDGKRDYNVTVEFDTAGIKKMQAAFANLKKI